MRDDLRLMPIWLGLGVALVLFVWYLSLTSAPPVAGLAGSDKLGHLLAYCVQALWFSWLVERPWQRWVGLGFIAQGIGLELLQGLIGLRQPELADAVANTAGVLLGLGLGRGTDMLLRSVEQSLVSRRG